MPMQAWLERILGWQAQRSLDEMCADSWRWQRSNPDGYVDANAPAPPALTVPSQSAST